MTSNIIHRLRRGTHATANTKTSTIKQTAVTLLGIYWIGFALAHAVLLRGLPHGMGIVIDVLVDPNESFTVHAAESESEQGYSPFEGQELSGRVKSTFLRGALIYDQGTIVGEPRDGPCAVRARPNGAKRSKAPVCPGLLPHKRL